MKVEWQWVGPGLLTFALLLTLGACSASEPKADVAFINGPDPETLDPALATGLEDLRIIPGLFEGLARLDPKTGRAIPGLAESWDISADGRNYTFHLRSNLLWTTGQAITADDVIYSWRRVLDPKTASEYAGQLYYVKNAEAYNSGTVTNADEVGIRAEDSRTVRVELNSPTAFFLDLCAFQTLAVVPRQIIEKYGAEWMSVHPLPTSGPYLLDYWRLNSKVRLRQNSFYWDNVNTKSAVVDFLSVSSPATALNLYESGQADVIWDVTSVPSELLDELKKRSDFHTFPILGTYFLRFNTTRKPFDDSRVRRALALAIDKPRLVSRFLHGGETVADHLVPNGTANYQSISGLGYDPARARQLLAEAGFPGGRGFPAFHYLFDSSEGGGRVYEQVAVELQHEWQTELGLNVEITQMEKKVYLSVLDRLDYDVARSTWIGDYNDPNTFLDLFSSNNGNNRTGWKNSRYDALIREGNQQPDTAKRTVLLQQAETILVRDELPIVPIYFFAGFNYFNPDRIKGIYGNMIDEHPPNGIYKTAK